MYSSCVGPTENPSRRTKKSSFVLKVPKFRKMFSWCMDFSVWFYLSFYSKEFWAWLDIGVSKGSRKGHNSLSALGGRLIVGEVKRVNIKFKGHVNGLDKA